MRRELDSTRDALASYTYRVLIAVAIVALAVLAWALADVLILLFGGVLLASALRALSDPLAQRTGLSSRLALTVVVVLVAAALVIAGWTVGGQIATQLQQLTQVLPDALDNARQWLERSPIGAGIVNLARQGAEGMRGAVSGIARFASATFGALANTVLILFLGLYLAVEPDLYRRGILHLVPVAARERTALAMAASGHALKKWLLGQLIAMLTIGVITGVGLSLLGIPLALSLGLIAGLLEFIPFIGPILSAVPAVLVGFTQGGWTPLYVVLFYLVVQQIEGNVLMPIVQKWAVALPPALGLLGVVIFGLLFGVLGILFATPLMVVVMVLVQKLYVDTTVEVKPPSAEVKVGKSETV